MTIALTLDQLYRPQPGGIGTYVRGLTQGLRQLGEDVIGVAPAAKTPMDVRSLDVPVVHAPVPTRFLPRVWGASALGVPRHATVVHATSMAGPFFGGLSDARHSVTVHDLLWRDFPQATTADGASFHEERLQRILSWGHVRIFVTSPVMKERMIAEGCEPERVTVMTLGSDDVVTPDLTGAKELLTAQGVNGSFTLASGTKEPRKNLPRLVAAHRAARANGAPVGPLVLTGPAGWGEETALGAIDLGVVPWATLLGLYQLAAVVAYVPLAEGWGFPPVEALRQGTAVVATTSVPSVAANETVFHCVAEEEDSIAAALSAASFADSTPTVAQARRNSVATFTWRACASTHLAAWR